MDVDISPRKRNGAGFALVIFLRFGIFIFELGIPTTATEPHHLKRYVAYDFVVGEYVFLQLQFRLHTTYNGIYLDVAQQSLENAWHQKPRRLRRSGAAHSYKMP